MFDLSFAERREDTIAKPVKIIKASHTNAKPIALPVVTFSANNETPKANCIEGAMYWSIPIATIGTFLAAAANNTKGNVVMGPPSTSNTHVVPVRGSSD